MGWKEVQEKILQDGQNKWDRQVSSKEVRVAESGALQVLNGHTEAPEFSLSDTATLQMCQRLEIPAKYFRRLPSEMKAAVANYDLENGSGVFS